MTKRHVEIFTAGCPLCEDAIKQVTELACSHCEVTVHDLRASRADKSCEERAHEVGVSRVPAVAIDGVLAACCTVAKPTNKALRAAGIDAPA